MAQRNYPEYRDYLNSYAKKLGKEIPEALAGFNRLRTGTMGDGALSKRVKELIAVGISIASRCDGCIAYHVGAALKAGATRPEVLDTIGVGMLMGGGPSMVYGCEALAALEQFETSK